jgi:hypothetical protein
MSSQRCLDRVPAGLIVQRPQPDGHPWTMRGGAGGRAVFRDTGAGKGDHLSWIDLA